MSKLAVRLDYLGEDQDVAVISFVNSPVNALTVSLRLALSEAFSDIDLDRAKAVILRAEGGNFCSATPSDMIAGSDSQGFDVSRNLNLNAAGISAALMGDFRAEPRLYDLCQQIVEFPLPVIAALHGVIAGAGAELALAAHHRVGTTRMRLVFSEVAFGLIPQAGSVQRLAQIIGEVEALRLLTRAPAIEAEEALAFGLIDVIASEDAFSAALSLAQDDLPEPIVPPEVDPEALRKAKAFARRGVLPAPRAIIAALEGSDEQALYADLVQTPEAPALIAFSKVERLALDQAAQYWDAKAAKVRVLGLAGADSQTVSLAYRALVRGLEVVLIEADPMKLAWAQRNLGERQDLAISLGKMTLLQRDTDLARLHFARDTSNLDRIGVLLHGPNGKARQLLARSPALPQAVLGGAKGYAGLSLSPESEVAELALPADFPAANTAALVALLRRLGVMPLVCSNLPVIGQRMSNAGRSALEKLIKSGIHAVQIIDALDEFGHPEPEGLGVGLLPDENAAKVMTNGEIIRRWLGALATEGAALLRDGTAAQPADIDYLLVKGYGFPRWRGGPMYQAGRLSIAKDTAQSLPEDIPA